LAGDNGSGKWTCNESGANTGFIARWTGRIAPMAVSEALVQNVDIAPTVFELCGATPAAGAVLDGISFADVLLMGAAGARSSLYLEMGYQRAVIDRDNLKYLAQRAPADAQQKAKSGKKEPAPDELFDLATDPDEQTNLAAEADRAATLAKLKGQMGEYCRRLPHRFAEFTPAQAG
jgi:arylsulfatase A-like enzyme